MRGLSDTQLVALLESFPEGIAFLDGDRTVWANRRASALMALRATTSSDDEVGTELGVLVGRLVGAMPALRCEELAGWTVVGGGFVEVALRRMWSSQVAVRLAPSSDLVGASYAAGAAVPPTTWQLIVAEQMLEESIGGIVVANAAGRIAWMNAQAQRLLGAATRRAGGDAQRTIARAARHVARGQLGARIRMNLELPTRMLRALFWNVAPGLAGVTLDGDVAEAAAFGRERLIA
ncbi:MAG TPA: PAS domain-containing protein [Polyangia bacterium]